MSPKGLEFASLFIWRKMDYSFWEHLKPEGRVLLKDLMPKDWQPAISPPVVPEPHYPTLEECERNVRQVIGEVSPGRTRGIV